MLQWRKLRKQGQQLKLAEAAAAGMVIAEKPKPSLRDLEMAIQEEGGLSETFGGLKGSVVRDNDSTSRIVERVRQRREDHLTAVEKVSSVGVICLL